MATDPLVKVEHASKRFMGVTVLDDVSLRVHAGDRIAMMGPNGAGKTTLLRCMLGFYHLDGGTIRVLGHDPIGERVRVLEHIGFIPQLPPPIKLTVAELLRFVEHSTATRSELILEQASAMDLDLLRHGSKPFFKLSGGMKQKFLIAIALARACNLLIFDEPTASLDPKAREHFYRLLQGLEHDFAAIYITHRAEELEGLVNRHITMDLGQVVEDIRVV